eukprot:1450911-Pyramimonas_sp.AAC.1
MVSTLERPKTEFAKLSMDSQSLGGSSCRSRVLLAYSCPQLPIAEPVRLASQCCPDRSPSAA